MADTRNVTLQIKVEGQTQGTGDLRQITDALKKLGEQSELDSAFLAQMALGLEKVTQGVTQGAQGANQLAQAYLALAQATQNQTDAYVQVQTAAKALREEQAALAAAAKQAREEAAAAGEVWKQAFAVAGAVGIATSLSAILGQMKEFAISVVETGAKLQTLRLSLASTSGGAAEGARVYGFLTETSNRLGVDTIALATNYRNMQAAVKGTSLEGGALKDIFLSVVEASKTLGLSEQQVQQALLAVDRMMQTNVINARELRQQLGIALPGSIEIMARSLGVTTQQLFEMTKKSELLADEVLPRFASQLRKELGGGADAASQTAESAFKRLGNALVAVKDDLSQNVLGPLTQIANVAAGLIRQGADARQRQSTRGEETTAGQLAGLGLAGKLAKPEDIAELRDLNIQIAHYQELLQGKGLSSLAGLDQELLRTRGMAGIRQAMEDVQARRDEFIAALPNRPRRFELNTEAPELMGAAGGGPFQRAMDLEKQASAALDGLETKLRELQKKTVLELAGQTVTRAKELTDDARAERKKAIEGTLEDVATILNKRPAGFGGYVPGLRSKFEGFGREVGVITEAIDAEKEAVKAEEQRQREIEQGIKQAEHNVGVAEEQARQRRTVFEETLARQHDVAEAAATSSAEQRRAAEALVSELPLDQLRLPASVRARLTGQADTPSRKEDLLAQIRDLQGLKEATTGATQEAQRLQIVELKLGEGAERLALGRLEGTKALKEQTRADNAYTAAAEHAAQAAVKQIEAQDTFNIALKNAIDLANATPEDTPAQRFRGQARRQGLTIGPEQETQLAALTEADKAKAQAKEITAIYRDTGHSIEQSLSSAFTNAFQSGKLDASAFGVSILQGLQQTFAQLSTKLMNAILNRATGATEAGGGWLGAVADILVKGVSAYFGKSTSSATIPAGAGAQFSAAGGSASTLFDTTAAWSGSAHAGGGYFPLGLGTVRALAGGSIIDRPSFAFIGENAPGIPEAVIPMPNGRVPVQMLNGGQAQQSQPFVIEIHNDYSGAFDPRALRTTKTEIIRHTIEAINSDGPLRQVIRSNAR